MKTLARLKWFLSALLCLFTLQPASAFFDPAPQRWINRDPLFERENANLYCFVDNEPIATIDLWGLKSAPGTVVVIPRLHPGGKHDNGAEKAGRDAVLSNMKEEGYTVYSASSVPDANAQLKKCKTCISELNIQGHGRGAGMWIGYERSSENYFAAVPDSKATGGYSFHNVDAMFGGLSFCKPCTIYLRGCSIASQDGYPALKAKIASITGCTVNAFATDTCAGAGGRGLGGPMDPKKEEREKKQLK